MKRFIPILLAAATIVIGGLAAEARPHRSWRVPAERRIYYDYPLRQRVGVWYNNVGIEYTNWGNASYDSGLPAPRVYFDHYGRPIDGACVADGNWTVCGSHRTEVRTIIIIDD